MVETPTGEKNPVPGPISWIKGRTFMTKKSVNHMGERQGGGSLIEGKE